MLKRAVKKAFNVAGLDIRRKRTRPPKELTLGENQIVPDIWKRPVYIEMMQSRLGSIEDPVLLLGESVEIEPLRSELLKHGFQVKGMEWDWEQDIPLTEGLGNSRIILCKVPMNESEWRSARKLKQRFGQRLVGLQEIVLPFTAIRQAQDSLVYSVGTLEEIAPYYLGNDYFGPLDELDKVMPLANKTIIEFGPMEGAQTAGLVRLGAKSVTCIEARAESFIKTMVAKYAFGWDNVNLVMDDFHNADDLKYGKFDLAFAHGVYYHSVAPFFFFENLMSLSDNIFLGGYTYAESGASSNGQFVNLEYGGKEYRAMKIPVGQSFNTAVNLYGYHFSGNDLQSFFSDRQYKITVISEEDAGDPWGDRYLRFLATRS
jgi:hypothetical protein